MGSIDSNPAPHTSSNAASRTCSSCGDTPNASIPIRFFLPETNSLRKACGVALAVLLGAFVPAGRAAAADAPNAPVCALFSAADARRIMGGPMKEKADRGAIVCMYELTDGGYGTVALTVVKSKDKPAEDRAWASMKETRHLQAGQKNTKAVAGIGDEAWFTGNVEKGKAGLSAIIVRKGSVHFAIDVATLDYRASPEAMTDIAKRIAQTF